MRLAGWALITALVLILAGILRREHDALLGEISRLRKQVQTSQVSAIIPGPTPTTVPAPTRMPTPPTTYDDYDCSEPMAFTYAKCRTSNEWDTTHDPPFPWMLRICNDPDPEIHKFCRIEGRFYDEEPNTIPYGFGD